MHMLLKFWYFLPALQWIDLHTAHFGDHCSRLRNSNVLIPLIVSSLIFKLSWLNMVYTHFIHQSRIWPTIC